MKTTNSYGIYFTIRPDKMKDGKAPVYVCITVNGKKIFMALKHWVNIKQWDKRKGCGKTSTVEGKDLNNYLEDVRNELGDCYRQLQVNRKIITAEAIKQAFQRTGEDEHTLRKLIEYHNTTQQNTLAWGTLKNYYTTQKYLELFLKDKIKAKDVHLSELNYKFIQDFEHYLRNYQPLDHHAGMSNNGVMKHLERLRKMLNLAVRLEWLSRDPFEKYKMKFLKVDKEFLTAQELKIIETKEMKVERIAMVRDLFVFCCYTGLAYIDVINLKPENVIQAFDGKDWIKTHRQKSNVPVNTPILPKGLQILEKYRDNIRASSRGTIFPMISNQKVNSYLKEIADLCGIKKNITFHLARHTFATTVTLSNGVPIETVSKMLGHTKIATTQVYARVLERKISEDMAKLHLKLG
ncbi:site-specific integrase [Paradesertivirga mongoliensis]|uniref:Site-specific integrase n=1 Tax=Paradesertivirga mongoliensis TaxID=2100740 RepID=A0ABW4ZQN0_9SPHI|nr:site-specific integrase [Pedobacter mongoliensis]